MRFLGIDLTFSPRKPSAFAVLSGERQVLEAGSLRTDSDLVARAQQWSPCLVAIDAPLDLPPGLCCLEESCPCRPVSPLKGRSCERALAHLGIGCFFTTKRSIIKAMVYRGIALKATLEERGYTVLETYPYATKVQLFGRPLPPKLTRQGRKVLSAHLMALLPDLVSLKTPLTHDLSDALLASYTGYLFSRGETEALGEPGEVQMIIPRG